MNSLWRLLAVTPLLLETLRMADSWETLKLLADSTRVRILSLLVKKCSDMGQSRISSHLGLLRQGELVHDRRESKKTFCTQPSLRSARLSAHGGGLCPVDGSEQILLIMRILNVFWKSVSNSRNNILIPLLRRLGKNYCPGRSWEAVPAPSHAKDKNR